MPSSASCDKDAIYLDYNATTPMAAEVVADITTALTEHWANPSSAYARAISTRERLQEARCEVAACIGAQPDNVVFTSGGTEGNNAVVAGCVGWYKSGPRSGGTPHVVTTDVEHDSVAVPLRRLEKRGAVTVTWLSAADGGGVSADSVLAAVTADTCLVTVIMANNETGVVNDIAAIGRGLNALPARERLWFHTDSAQAVGKLPVDVTQLHVDFLTVVGHKLYGPRVGALYCSRRALAARQQPGGWPCVSLLCGGGQERGLRAGTENVPMAVGLATACRLVRTGLERDVERMARLRDLLEQQLLSCGAAERVNCARSRRLPNTSSVALACGRHSGAALLARLPALMASTAAACHSHRRRHAPSGVLVRSGVSEAAARRTVRLSVGRHTTEHEIAQAVRLLRRAVTAAQMPPSVEEIESRPTAAKLARIDSGGCPRNSGTPDSEGSQAPAQTAETRVNGNETRDNQIQAGGETVENQGQSTGASECGTNSAGVCDNQERSTGEQRSRNCQERLQGKQSG